MDDAPEQTVGPLGREMFDAIAMDDAQKARSLIEAGWTYGPIERAPLASGMGFGLWSPVEFAAFESSPDCLALMLGMGGRPGEGPPDRSRPSLAMHFAAQLSDEACLRLLLDAGGDPRALDQRGAAPLGRVALGGCEASARALIEAGADPNAQDSTGRSALCEALCEEDPQLIGALLDLGADPWRAQGGWGEGVFFEKLEAKLWSRGDFSLRERLRSLRESRELGACAGAAGKGPRPSL